MVLLILARATLFGGYLRDAWYRRSLLRDPECRESVFGGPDCLLHAEALLISYLVTRDCRRPNSRNTNAKSISRISASWQAILSRLPSRRPPSYCLCQQKLMPEAKIAALVSACWYTISQSVQCVVRRMAHST